ncbi:helix-hairpin-helix domain-containing protein [Piscibacillus sp. B03]|uniref:helix-hairpin-helix domain-containing protein n=1 Tax=Piscibacillus sp. B03 TaxID=3457430 RepID=UPI003FCE6E98
MPINKVWFIIPVIFLIIVYIFWPKNEHDLVVQEDVVFVKQEEDLRHNEINQPDSIMVDVKGEVKVPGVYKMKDGERVIDVIEQAGGLTENADEASVNLAMILKDEMVIHVRSGDIDNDNESYETQSNKIPINTADVNDLTQIPGIGEQKAKAIIQYREEHGFFKSAEDLLNISGIGEKTLDRIREFIVVP